MTHKRTKKQQEQVDWLYARVRELDALETTFNHRWKRYPKIAAAIRFTSTELFDTFVKVCANNGSRKP